MQVKWFSGCKTEAERTKRAQIVKESEIILDILAKICYNITSEQEKIAVGDYESPSWAYKQADRNGYLRAYQEITKMCEQKDN